MTVFKLPIQTAIGSAVMSLYKNLYFPTLTLLQWFLDTIQTICSLYVDLIEVPKSALSKLVHKCLLPCIRTEESFSSHLHLKSSKSLQEFCLKSRLVCWYIEISKEYTVKMGSQMSLAVHTHSVLSPSHLICILRVQRVCRNSASNPGFEM